MKFAFTTSLFLVCSCRSVFFLVVFSLSHSSCVYVGDHLSNAFALAQGVERNTDQDTAACIPFEFFSHFFYFSFFFSFFFLFFFFVFFWRVREGGGGRGGDEVSAQLWISRERLDRVEILKVNVHDDQAQIQHASSGVR